MSWIKFVEVDNSPNITKQWSVQTSNNENLLGTIKWHAPWRRYAFFPAIYTVFEQDCLREISTFIEERTQERKAARKQERNQI